MLIGYGAHAVCPYLAFETCRQWRTSPRTEALVKQGAHRLSIYYCLAICCLIVNCFPISLQLHPLHREATLVLCMYECGEGDECAGKLPDLTAAEAQKNYKKALEKGLLKIISKMGISLLSCYHGAQILEIYGTLIASLLAPLPIHTCESNCGVNLCIDHTFLTVCCQAMCEFC